MKRRGILNTTTYRNRSHKTTETKMNENKMVQDGGTMTLVRQDVTICNTVSG